MTQKYDILDYLQTHSGITPQEAKDLFGCMRLAARIGELRKEGYMITTAMIKDWNGKHNRWQRYAKYRLEGKR